MSHLQRPPILYEALAAIINELETNAPDPYNPFEVAAFNNLVGAAARLSRYLFGGDYDDGGAAAC